MTLLRFKYLKLIIKNYKNERVFKNSFSCFSAIATSTRLNRTETQTARVSNFHSSQFIEAERLVVESFGDPSEVVKMESIKLPLYLKEDEVLVKSLASPINPADINMIQGVYAIKPPLPFVPGNEGVMEVINVGSSVTSMTKGDRIIPMESAMGTFATAFICSESKVFKVPKDLDIPTLATIAVNPGTAYRMLLDFVRLQPGECVAQNCANSAVGQAVIQIAKTMNLKTINIVRNRLDIGKLKQHLYSLGATIVLTEEEVRTSPEVKELPKPKLGFNGVSGKRTSDLLRLLEHGGTMVTYGGMSKQPLMVPVGSIIFNDVVLRGFWMTNWNRKHKRSEERTKMFDALFQMVRDGILQPPPHKLIPFEEYKTAFRDAMPPDGRNDFKQILTFE